MNPRGLAIVVALLAGTIATEPAGAQLPPAAPLKGEAAVLHDSLLVKALCDRVVPGFADRTQAALERRRKESPDVFREVEKSPTWNAHVETSLGLLRNMDPRQGRKLHGQCAVMEDSLVGPDPRCTSPEKAWAVFLEGLKAAESHTALACFTVKRKRKLSEVFAEMSKDELRRMGESFTDFRLSEGDGNSREAAITRDSGAAGKVSFVNESGAWKIDAM